MFLNLSDGHAWLDGICPFLIRRWSKILFVHKDEEKKISTSQFDLHKIRAPTKKAQTNYPPQQFRLQLLPQLLPFNQNLNLPCQNDLFILLQQIMIPHSFHVILHRVKSSLSDIGADSASDCFFDVLLSCGGLLWDS